MITHILRIMWHNKVGDFIFSPNRLHWNSSHSSPEFSSAYLPFATPKITGNQRGGNNELFSTSSRAGCSRAECKSLETVSTLRAPLHFLLSPATFSSASSPALLFSSFHKRLGASSRRLCKSPALQHSARRALLSSTSNADRGVIAQGPGTSS